MIKSTFDIDTVAEAVGFWIPGFRADLAAGPGDTADYRLRCTRNELIEDFDVHVAVQDGAAEVTVAGADGRTYAVRMPVGADGALGPITGPMVPMALEGIPSGDGTLECTVCMFSGSMTASPAEPSMTRADTGCASTWLGAHSSEPHLL